MKRTLLFLFCLILLACEKKAKIQKASREGYALYNDALTYLDRGISDSAFFIFEEAKNVFIEQGDSLNVANCLINMAITQKDQGDYYGAQETALQAIDYMDVNNPAHRVYLSTNYNNLGVATINLKDPEKAIYFYNLAIKFSDDSLNTYKYKNNLAVCYQRISKFKETLDLYKEIANSSSVKTSPTEYARVLSNLARTKWLQNPNYNAFPELDKALQIREKEKDLWGQNASFSHLSDYFANTDANKSLAYAQRMYKTAVKLNSSSDKLQALEKLIKLVPNSETRQYFEIYRLLNDSIQQAHAAAKNQFALIRYEVEKNKADNLHLEKENAEKQSRLVRQRAITGASISLLLLAVGGGSLWYKRRKQRLELEAQNRIKETQLNLSKKIHDVVANGIYRVMSEIENNDNVDRDGVLDKLEDMYHQSRDISHDVEQQTITEIPYSEQLASLLKSFAADQRLVLIAGNDPEQWEDVGKRVKDEVKHVLQELMVNMKKHSQAERVIIRFEKSDQQLMIFYKDNGVGMPAEKSGGKGLANTVSRIESLGGNIIFASEPGEGLSITTSIPLA